ncbi:hypothetical protein [Salinigranum halophilum]|uniref:hypothetical protein n=1 Tax=Salinigranum halophilum TaxID=2565931 RepID=UPI001375C057|nr:hypothetical protein [Salinigranum halophilum]
MEDPTPPPHATQLFEYVTHAIGDGIDLEQEELHAILEFDAHEITPLRSPVTSYFILGSYRSPYRYRLRSTAHELNKYGAYTVILGDVKQLRTRRLPDEDIMFTLIAAFSSYIVAIYEKDSGGEAPELGEIDDPPFFEKAYVYARDYDPNPTHDFDLVVQTLSDYFDSELDADEREQRLARRLTESESMLSRDTIQDIVDRRVEADEPPASYSWPHKNKFRKFELHSRFHSWMDPAALPALVVETIPGPTHG